jgi:hypothetical protein
MLTQQWVHCKTQNIQVRHEKISVSVYLVHCQLFQMHADTDTATGGAAKGDECTNMGTL